MQLTTFFDTEILKAARSFKLEGCKSEQRLTVDYQVEDLSFSVVYHRYVRDLRVAIDLEIEGEVCLERVYIDNLAFRDEVRKFWSTVMANQGLLESLVKNTRTGWGDITLGDLQAPRLREDIEALNHRVVNG